MKLVYHDLFSVITRIFIWTRDKLCGWCVRSHSRDDISELRSAEYIGTKVERAICKKHPKVAD